MGPGVAAPVMGREIVDFMRGTVEEELLKFLRDDIVEEGVALAGQVSSV